MPKLTGKTEFSADTAEVIRGTVTVEEAVNDLMRGYAEKSQAIRDQIVDQIIKKELDMEDLEDFDRLMGSMDRAGMFPRGRMGREFTQTDKRADLAAKKEATFPGTADESAFQAPKSDTQKNDEGLQF